MSQERQCCVCGERLLRLLQQRLLSAVVGFRLMHYHLPVSDVLFLHSGCNVGHKGDVTLFLGLSGTC